MEPSEQALKTAGVVLAALRRYGGRWGLIVALAALPATPSLQPSRIDYGSNLRDAAALVTLASEGGAPPLVLTAAVRRAS